MLRLDPAQVFTLLETAYHAFDKISEQMSVFKVETVGDCYVAAAGLPDVSRADILPFLPAFIL